MSRWIVTLLFIFLSLLVEGTVRHLPLISIRVDLLQLLVFFIGFYVSLGPGGLACLVLGLVQESVAAPLHGVLPLTYLIVFFFLRLTHHHLFIQGGTSQVIWIVLLTFAAKGIETALLAWQGYTPPFPLLELGASALLQGLLSLAIFPFLRNQGRIAPNYGP